jgi:hypothetical protein
VTNHHEREPQIVQPKGAAVQRVGIHVQQQVAQGPVRRRAQPLSLAAAGDRCPVCRPWLAVCCRVECKLCHLVFCLVVVAAGCGGGDGDGGRLPGRQRCLLDFPDRDQGGFEIRRVRSGKGGDHHLEQTSPAVTGALSRGLTFCLITGVQRLCCFAHCRAHRRHLAGCRFAVGRSSSSCSSGSSSAAVEPGGSFQAGVQAARLEGAAGFEGEQQIAEL